MKSIKINEMVQVSNELYDLNKAAFALVLLKGIMNNPYNEYMTSDVAIAIKDVSVIKDRLQRKLDAYLEGKKNKEHNDSSESSAKIDNQDDRWKDRTSGDESKTDSTTMTNKSDMVARIIAKRDSGVELTPYEIDVINERKVG